MSDSQLPEEPGLTKESWRPKFYGFIKEGHKARVSPIALKVGVIILSLLILGGQVLMSWDMGSKKSKGSTVRIPSLTTNQENLSAPDA